MREIGGKRGREAGFELSTACGIESFLPGETRQFDCRDAGSNSRAGRLSGLKISMSSEIH